MSGRILIHEVAKRAGCSIATVSNVLNNKGRVGEKTRQQVLRSVKALGYKTNAAGRNLRTRKTETLGLFFYPSCAKIFLNPFYAEVMEGLEEGLMKANYHLLLAGGQVSEEKFDTPDVLRQGKVDGMILLGRFPEKIIRDFTEENMPLLLLDSNAEWPADSVVSDGFSGEIDVVSHLVSKGHRRLVMLAYDWDDYNIDLRVQGFLAGLSRHGIEGGEKNLIRSAILDEPLYAQLKKRLEGPNPPTALVAVNDTMARKMIGWLRADGYRIPEQLSVVGFDDDVMSGFDPDPPLSTVRIDKKQLGRVGAELILKRIADPKAPVSKLRLPVEFIPRKSVVEVR
ncbi:MAG TPA: LacI family DNA-binding transcriptional regulator [Candidatus Methylacidiphilales bacterium]